jgi:glycosyltransferase involved in cell wall biosynthesis
VLFRRPLLEAMIARGHKVTACAPPGPEWQVDSLAASGVAYRTVPFDRTALNPFKDTFALYALVRIFHEIKPDVVLACMSKPVIYGSLAARVARVPAIFSMIEGLGYAFSTAGLKSYLVRIGVTSLYRMAMPHNRRVFFLNPDDQALFEELRLIRDASQPLLLNGIGVDLDHFSPQPLPDTTTTSFLLIGRLLRSKGIEEYAQAARLIRARHPEVRFRLVGEFDNNPHALRKADMRAWVDEAIIEYLGVLRDVRPAIANSSVFVLPSYREGLPRTVLEAMAIGRPVITTDSPGCRETVEHGRNGYLVPVGDVPALVQAMEAFIQQPEQIETMGFESRRIAEAKYDVHKVNQVILEAMGLA